MPNGSRLPNGLRVTNHNHQHDGHEWLSESSSTARYPAEPNLNDAPAKWIRPETAAAISPDGIAATTATFQCLPEAAYACQLHATTTAAKHDALQHQF